MTNVILRNFAFLANLTKRRKKFETFLTMNKREQRLKVCNSKNFFKARKSLNAKNLKALKPLKKFLNDTKIQEHQQQENTKM